MTDGVDHYKRNPDRTGLERMGATFPTDYEETFQDPDFRPGTAYTVSAVNFYMIEGIAAELVTPTQEGGEQGLTTGESS